MILSASSTLPISMVFCAIATSVFSFNANANKLLEPLGEFGIKFACPHDGVRCIFRVGQGHHG